MATSNRLRENMVYCSETDVLEAVGLSSAKVQSISGKDATEVTAMITRFITKGQGIVQNWVGVPHKQRHEIHEADGEKFEFDLGPEDSEFNIGRFDPENCVEKVYAVYLNGERRKLPYPEDCELGTENDHADYTGTNCVITSQTTTPQHGTYFTQGVFSAAGVMLYPSAKNLAKNIDIFTHFIFRFKSSNAGVTFTVKFFDKDDNYTSKTFTVEKANIWYLVMLKIDNFTDSGAKIDWDGDLLYAISIETNGACTVGIDNAAFCDGWIYTAPSGKVVWAYDTSISESPLSEGNKIEVTYSFDPFKVTVPEAIKSGTAKVAGYHLLEYLIGVRQADTQFVVEGDTLEPAYGRDVLERRKMRLLESAKEDIASYGYSYDGGVV